jgi:RNA polymerase sigma factor (sigma-70 family)
MRDLRSCRRGWDPVAVQASDAELIRGAWRGDAGALAVLLHRHRPALLAVAVALVGRDEAEDVVHDAFLVALGHVGDVRDPSAAGAWLRAIVRTQSLMRVRARREHPVDELETLAGPSGEAGPEEMLERLALRGWVWSALERLSEPLRVVALLRYFGSRCSYAEIAAILGVPVGTVRSRLSQVRVKLADALLAEATRAHPDAAAREQASERYHRECVDAFNDGDLSGFTETWAADITGRPTGGPAIHGRARLADTIADATPRSGVRVLLDTVIASAEITVLEARLQNPAHAPDHCPTSTTQVHFHRGGRTRSILFAFGQPAQQDGTPGPRSPVASAA